MADADTEIQLDGGNDGINTVVPFKDEGYAKHRHKLRLLEKDLIKLTDDMAFHPRLRSASALVVSRHGCAPAMPTWDELNAFFADVSHGETPALARLHRALLLYMLDLHGLEHGYTEVAPPYLVRDQTLFGTGQLPKSSADQFRTAEGF